MSLMLANSARQDRIHFTFEGDEGFLWYELGSFEPFGSATGVLRSNAGRIDYVGLPVDGDVFVEKLIRPLSSDFSVDFDFEMIGGTFNVPWCYVSNFTDTSLVGVIGRYDFAIQNGVLLLLQGTLSVARLNIRGIKGSVISDSGVIDLLSGVSYYGTITRVGSTLNLFVYTDQARTAQVVGSPVSLSGQTTAILDYCQPLMSVNHTLSRSMTGWIDNIIQTG